MFKPQYHKNKKIKIKEEDRVDVTHTMSGTQ
jgi:hypothetical protein